MKRNKRILVLLLISCLMAASICSGCGGKKIPIPFSSVERLGSDYTKVVGELTRAGFTKVNTEPVNTAHKDNEGKVESILVDGKTTFKRAEEFSEKAPIVVRYYRLIDKKDSGNGVSFFK